jgi:hypothetical protein
MRSIRNSLMKNAALFFLCLLVLPFPAYGYIDPNATGLISQIVTPLLIAAAAGVTVLRKRLAAIFSGLAERLRRRTDA